MLDYECECESAHVCESADGLVGLSERGKGPLVSVNVDNSNDNNVEDDDDSMARRRLRTSA